MANSHFPAPISNKCCSNYFLFSHKVEWNIIFPISGWAEAWFLLIRLLCFKMSGFWDLMDFFWMRVAVYFSQSTAGLVSLHFRCILCMNGTPKEEEGNMGGGRGTQQQKTTLRKWTRFTLDQSQDCIHSNMSQLWELVYACRMPRLEYNIYLLSWPLWSGHRVRRCGGTRWAASSESGLRANCRR